MSYPPVTCVFCEKTGMVRRFLRRYVIGGTGVACPGKYGYHNASIPLDDIVPQLREDGCLVHSLLGDPKSFSGYPLKCDYCDYVFKEEDERQIHPEWLFIRKSTGELVTDREFKPGDMWFLDYFPDKWASKFHQARGGGPVLNVMCPNGEQWCIDQKSRNGEGWERSGEPPFVTAWPSIVAGDYHGWLTGGVFNEC